MQRTSYGGNFQHERYLGYNAYGTCTKVCQPDMWYKEEGVLKLSVESCIRRLI
jgi:hypothetical protein